MSDLINDLQQEMKMEEFTYDQLVEMFKTDESLNEEFKSTILSQFNAIGQAMWNCVNQREATMVMANTYGDCWQEEHNRFVELFQKYHQLPKS